MHEDTQSPEAVDVSATPTQVTHISLGNPGGASNTLVAYALWFFLGIVGAHRFYTGRSRSALFMLGMTLASWVLYATIIGAVLALPLSLAVGIWWVLDAFRIPGWTSVSAPIASVSVTREAR